MLARGFLLGCGFWLAAGCSDLASPAELASEQVLAVRADPPALPAGGRARLSLIVAGPDGKVEPEAITWRPIAVADGQPPLGSIELSADGATDYLAPREVPAQGAFAAVEATVSLAGGEQLVAIKALALGVPAGTENPTITEVLIDGRAIDGDVVLSPSQLVTLDAAIAPDLTAGAQFAWYATDGEIELYRRSPTELRASSAPSEGVLYLVYRDGAGGVAWKEIPLAVR